MASILAVHSYCCLVVEPIINGKLGDDLTFSSSVSKPNYSKFSSYSQTRGSARKLHKFHVGMQQTELPPKLGSNGRVIKLVPTTEVRKKMSLSTNPSKVVNGSAKNVNGGTRVVNGGSLVKRDGLPPIDGLKVLPSDEGFSWADENYNSVQRTIDVWSFVLSFRVRLLLDNAKWSYIGGFTEEKQVKRRRETASWLRECVLQLGPTFIKLGQLSSTRSDLFPKEFVEELAKLQGTGFFTKQSKELY